MNSQKSLCALVLSLFILALVTACGGGGGGGTSIPTTTVKGVVFAGPVTGCSVTVQDQAGAVVAGPVNVTSLDGSCSIAVPTSALSQPLYFVASGGSYTDEATSSQVTLGSFTAYAAPGSLGPGANVTLDPSSTIVARLVSGGKTLAQAQSAFSAAFGYTPDCTVAPAFANVSSAASQASRLAGLRAAYFSQLTADLALPPGKQSELIEALAEDLADGTLDGKRGSTAVTTTSGVPIPEDIINRFATAAVAFTGSANNKTKLGHDKIDAPPCGTVALTASYRVEYLPPAGGDVTARDTFQLKITKKSDGTAASGLASSIVLTPLMVMSTMSGATTWPDAATETGSPGTYSATVYYSMATTGLDMYWKLSVAIGSEVAVFYPKVAPLPAGNSASAKLSSSTDKVGATARTYRIWRDTIAPGGSGYDFTVFLSSTDAGNTQPVYPGAAWTTPALTLSTVTLQLSSDNGTTWVPMTPQGSTGRYTVSGLALSAGATKPLFIKLQINGNDYTTNGNPPDGNPVVTATNAVALLNVTP